MFLCEKMFEKSTMKLDVAVVTRQVRIMIFLIPSLAVQVVGQGRLFYLFILQEILDIMDDFAKILQGRVFFW